MAKERPATDPRRFDPPFTMRELVAYRRPSSVQPFSSVNRGRPAAAGLEPPATFPATLRVAKLLLRKLGGKVDNRLKPVPFLHLSNRSEAWEFIIGRGQPHRRESASVGVTHAAFPALQ
jgi:hypothetical protein